jgi:predicted lysophospholipase L1 biosynthesis ABC-type transport system permease subunit
MSNSVYKINKGINKSLEFKGLKAQYIWWLAAGIVGLLIVFAILYVIGINSFLSIVIVGALGVCVFLWVFKLSNKYGEHGMKKKMATRSTPKVIKSYCRKQFMEYGKKL